MNRFADAVDIAIFKAGEKTCVHLQTVGVQLFRHFDPVEDRHLAASYLFEVALRER
jgi:hypothetical protein